MGTEQKKEMGEVFKTCKLNLELMLLMKRGWRNFARI